MGGGAINIGIGEEIRKTALGLRFVAVVYAGVGAAGTWIDESSGPAHGCVDLTDEHESLADCRAQYRAKLHAILAVLKAGGDGELAQAVLVGLFGETTAGAIMALNGPEGNPITEPLFQLLVAKAGLL